MVNLHDRCEIKWCSVNISDVFSRGKRFEASVFDVEAKRARQLVFKGRFHYVCNGSGHQVDFCCGCFSRPADGKKL